MVTLVIGFIIGYFFGIIIMCLTNINKEVEDE